jgi:hypothetical protein
VVCVVDGVVCVVDGVLGCEGIGDGGGCGDLGGDRL